MVCRLCGVANVPQQTSCQACGSPLEETAGAVLSLGRGRAVKALPIWPGVCAGVGGGLGYALGITLAASDQEGAGLAGVIGGASAGILLGILPGRAGEALRRSAKTFINRRAHRLCARIRQQAEAALEAGDEPPDTRARLAAVLWLQGQRDRAGQVLRRAAQLPETSPVGQHNLAVAHAASGHPALALELLAKSEGTARETLRWNEGLVRYSLGQYAEAAAVFGQLAAGLSGDPTVGYAHAVALARTGDLEQAKSALANLVHRRPRETDARCDLGVVQHACGRPDLAAALFADVLRHTQSHPAARFNHGLCALLVADYRTAIDDFMTLSRVAPDHAWGAIHRAICHHRMQRREAALETMRRAVRLAPADFLVRYNAGTLLLRENVVDRAVAELEKAYELAPDDVQAIINLGVAMYLNGHLRQALDHFRAARRLAPKHALARHNLVVTMTAFGLIEEAEQEVQELVALYPNFVDAHHAIGVVRLLQNRLLEAVEQLRRATDMMPRSAVVRSNLALTYYVQGDVAAARDQAEQAVALDASLAAARDIAGHCALELDDKPGAIAHFQALIRLEPSHPDAHSNLGLAYYKDDRLREAIESYKRTLIFAPKSPEGHTDLGLAYAKDRQLEEAATHLKQVVEWRPNNPIIRSNLGLVCYFKGDIEDAVASWREVTRLSPRYARQREATRFSAYDDQEMYIRPMPVKTRAIHLPPRLAPFQHHLQWAFHATDYRLSLPWPDLARCERWLRRAALR